MEYEARTEFKTVNSVPSWKCMLSTMTLQAGTSEKGKILLRTWFLPSIGRFEEWSISYYCGRLIRERNEWGFGFSPLLWHFYGRRSLSVGRFYSILLDFTILGTLFRCLFGGTHFVVEICRVTWNAHNFWQRNELCNLDTLLIMPLKDVIENISNVSIFIFQNFFWTLFSFFPQNSTSTRLFFDITEMKLLSDI